MSVRQPAIQTRSASGRGQLSNEMTVPVLICLILAALGAAAWHLVHHNEPRTRRRGYRPRHRGLTA